MRADATAAEPDKAIFATGVDIIGVDVNGCFAPYVVLPESNIWKVDPDIPDDQACLFDPFGNAMHTVMAQPISGKQVLVTGCGTIGLMAIGICHAGGADSVIAVDPNPIKREFAKTMGATHVLEATDEKTIKELTDRDGADVLLEMSGPSEGDCGSVQMCEKWRTGKFAGYSGG